MPLLSILKHWVVFAKALDLKKEKQKDFGYCTMAQFSFYNGDFRNHLSSPNQFNFNF